MRQVRKKTSNSSIPPHMTDYAGLSFSISYLMNPYKPRSKSPGDSKVSCSNVFNHNFEVVLGKHYLTNRKENTSVLYFEEAANICIFVTAQPQPQPKSTSTRVGIDKVISWTTHTTPPTPPTPHLNF